MKAIVFIIKIAVLMLILKYGFEYYDSKKTFYSQHIVVWILIYIPTFMGYEEIIDLIFNPKK